MKVTTPSQVIQMPVPAVLPYDDTQIKALISSIDSKLTELETALIQPIQPIRSSLDKN